MAQQVSVRSGTLGSLVRSVTLGGVLDHPQGITPSADGTTWFVTAVLRKEQKGLLVSFRASDGGQVQRVEVQDGPRYHPGGLGRLADTLWVPVPLHYARLVERGFNQAALLGRWLAHATRTRFAPRALLRKRSTSQQAQLGRAERAENMRDAFCLRAPITAEIVLIDDVLTTGATLRACIFALEEKGVKVRAVFTLARTHPL